MYIVFSFSEIGNYVSFIALAVRLQIEIKKVKPGTTEALWRRGHEYWAVGLQPRPGPSEPSASADTRYGPRVGELERHAVPDM